MGHSPLVLDVVPAPAGVDLSRPTPARLYDYYLGGTNNYQVDRDAAADLLARVPEVHDAAWANRAFHQRAVMWLAAECGIQQFIDIGSGLPTRQNTHDAVHLVRPGARVAYIDVDPQVRAQSRPLLAGDGTTRVITADMREPETILQHPDARALIDFGQPVALVMTAVLHFVGGASDPWALVGRYVDAVPAGSYLVLSHITGDQKPPASVLAFNDLYARTSQQICLRARPEIGKFFAGLDMVRPYRGGGPAVCWLGEWRAEDVAAADSDGSRWGYCGVARIG